MEQLGKLVEILKALLKDRAGSFILGVITTIIPAYFVVVTLTKDIEKKEKELSVLNKRVGILQVQSDSCGIYINRAYEEGRESAIKYIEYSKELLDDIENRVHNKNQRLRNKVRNMKEGINNN